MSKSDFPAAELHPIRCGTCGETFSPEQLEHQLKGYLKRHFSGRRLTDALRNQIIAMLRPWWDRFTAGESVCFRCGVDELGA